MLTWRTMCVMMLPTMVGCETAPRSHGPYHPQTEIERNPLRAQALTMRAADILDDGLGESSGHLDDAEALLREALSADLHHGPAHNNLGIIYLAQGKLYEAAGEFEWARKLMPGHPDPRINLALTLESAGRVDEAIASYEGALEVYPHNIAALQGLVRLQLRYGREDDQTRERLSEIALRGEDETWRQWAREQMMKVP